MLNSCKNSVKILKMACIHAGTVANEGITKNALLDQKTDVYFHTGFFLSLDFPEAVILVIVQYRLIRC